MSRDGTCFTKTCHYHAFDQEAGLGCDGHGQFPAGESAYRKRHSTETVMIRVLSDALMAADRQQVTLLRAARLVCSIRLRRSHSSAAATGPPVWSGRRGLAVDEIVRQRSDATSLVRRTTVISATTPIRCTTRISPRSTLFVMYTAELHHGLILHQYAIDCQVYLSTFVGDAPDAVERFSRCLEDVEDWMSTSRLRLNPTKPRSCGWVLNIS